MSQHPISSDTTKHAPAPSNAAENQHDFSSLKPPLTPASASRETYTLSEHTFIKLLPAHIAPKILDAAKVFTEPDGSILFQEGDQPQALYLVLAGEVAISKINSSGTPVNLISIGSGGQFGDFGLFPDEPRSATATTVGATTLARVPAEIVATCVWGESVQAGRHILEPIIARIGAATNYELEARYQNSLSQMERHYADAGTQLRSTCHDIRNSQQIMGLAADAILQIAEPQTHIATSGTAIIAEVGRISGLIEGILSYAKQGTSSAPLLPTIAEAFVPNTPTPTRSGITTDQEARAFTRPLSAKHHPLVRHFSDQRGAELLSYAEFINFPSGSRLFKEGEASDSLYLVLAGDIEITKKNPDNRDERVLVVDQGGHFGDFGVLDDGLRSASATALSDSLLARIPGEALSTALWGDRVAAGKYLIAPTISRIRASTDQMIFERFQSRALEHTRRLVRLGLEFKAACEEIEQSHDVILTQCRQIHAAANDNRPIREFAQMIATQSDWMNEVTKKAIHFAINEDVLERKECCVGHLLSRFQQLHVLETYERLNNSNSGAADVRLTIASIEKSIFADEEQLLRVLQNLVVNAAQAFKGRPGHIHIEARDDGDHVRLLVSDDGPGLPESIRNSPFQAYHSEGKKGGCGLGMAGAKEIVEAHGGTIDFETAPNKGTIFNIRLPRSRTPSA